jgi:sugar phosphate isomerase/epimerase
MPREPEAILDGLRQIGYEGVELAGFFGHTPARIQTALRASGLVPAGNNVPIYELMRDPAEAVDVHRALGFFSLTAGGLRDEHLPGGDRYSETLEWMQELGTLCRKAGIRFLYHNHWKELKWTVDGVPLLDRLLRDLTTDVLALQPDLGWMQIGGADPLFYLTRYRDRCPMIHVKDFYATDMALVGDPFEFTGRRGCPERGDFEFRPTGFGISNIPSQIPYIHACHPAWVVTCHDGCYGRDAFEDLMLCHTYLNRLLVIQEATAVSAEKESP